MRTTRFGQHRTLPSAGVLDVTSSTTSALATPRAARFAASGDSVSVVDMRVSSPGADTLLPFIGTLSGETGTMPDPPAAGLLTRYVFENPYPLGAGLLLFAAIWGWLALRDGRLDRVRLTVLPLVLGAGVLAAGWGVVTAGERGRVLVRDLSDLVVARDLVGAVNQFADAATIHLGSPHNVGHDLDYLRGALSDLVARYAIESNRITSLDAYTTGADDATIHMACFTETNRFGGASQLVIDVARQPDGTWKIVRLTLVSVNGQPPGR